MTNVLAVGASDHVPRAASRLSEAGFETSVVPDVSSVRERDPLGQVDCVVTAVDLPDGTALDLLESTASTLPVLVCPDGADVAVLGRAVAHGADGIVPSAEIDDVLVERVTAAVDGSDVRAIHRSGPDVTEARVESDRLTALFESIPDAVVRTRIEGQDAFVEDVNPAFEEVFGIAATTIVGENLDDHIVPPSRVDRAEHLTRRGIEGEVVETEVQRLTANGTRDFLLTVVPLEVGHDPVVTYAIYTDITERKQRQQRLEVLNRILRHDLRNGMNVVHGSAQLLEEEVDGEAASHLESIQQRSRELLDLAAKTRTIERTLQSDAHDTGPVDVVEAVEDAIAIAGLDGAIDSLDLPSSTPARVDQLLPVAVRHVLDNAVEHHDGDPSIEVGVRERSHENAVEVVVADDGPGIPEEERSLVTERRQITQLRHGSGLGLWVVNWVVTGSGGDLVIEDNDPRGTVVRMILPQATADRKGQSVESD